MTTTTSQPAKSQLDLVYATFGIVAGIGMVVAIQALLRQWGGAETTPVLQAAANEAQTMGLPLVANTKAYWFLARAGGVTAYLLLWFATLWGVLMTGKLTKGVVDPPLAFGLHEFFPTLAMVFAAIHAVVLLGDAYIGFDLFDVLIPFRANYRTIWTGLGSLAFYLSVALIASFYLKRLVSRKVWRVFHYAAYLAFSLALIHGLMAGTDSSLPAIRWMYILTGATLLFATIYRILAMTKPARAAVQVTRATEVAAPQSASTRRRAGAEARSNARGFATPNQTMAPTMELALVTPAGCPTPLDRTARQAGDPVTQ